MSNDNDYISKIANLIGPELCRRKSDAFEDTIVALSSTIAAVATSREGAIELFEAAIYMLQDHRQGIMSPDADNLPWGDLER